MPTKAALDISFLSSLFFKKVCVILWVDVYHSYSIVHKMATVNTKSAQNK